MQFSRTGRIVMVLAATACSRGGSDGADAKSTLARDTALAADLREIAADTTTFVEAADVAMRDIPDSNLPMPSSPRATADPARQPTMRSAAPVTTPAAARPTASAPPAARAPAIAPPPIAAASTPAPRPAPSAAPMVSNADAPLASCSSPARDDQRRCLMAYLARSDLTLDRNYQAQIARLKREAGTPPGAPEPESVARLRTAQRAWLVYRDTECRNRNRGQEGPLWAPVRARCLAGFSEQRARELAG